MNAPLHFTTYRIDQRPAVLFAREDTSRWQPSEPLPSRPRAAEPEPETVSDWSQVHRRITELAAERARHERELGRWLLAAERLGVPMRAGYGSLREYAERVVGLNGRQTEERLRVARALAALPLVDRALGSGQLSWSAARELTRVAVPRTEKAWLGWAKGRRCREIEKAVAARRSGDSPTDRPDPSLVKRRLVFEVRAETMALFRDLQAAVRSDIIAADGPEAVDDDALLYEIARRALGGGGDECRASYQVAVTRCDGCGAVSIDAGGERHVVEDEVAEMMACDSQQLGVVDGRERGDEADSPHVGATAPTVDKEAESPAPRTPAPPPRSRRFSACRCRRRS